MDGGTHQDLAVKYGAQLRYRRMNFHEEASARAYSRQWGDRALTAALEDYRRAIEAFGNREDPEGIRLLHRSVPVIRESLGMAHPYAIQVTRTLAGRLRDEPGAEEERRRLYEDMALADQDLYGADHLNTLRSVCHHARLLRATGRTAESIAAFQRAFDGSVRALRTLVSRPEAPSHDPEIAVDVAVGVAEGIGEDSYRTLLELIPVDEHDERFGAVEGALLLLAPSGRIGSVIRRARLSRHPDLRWQFYARITEVLPTIRPLTGAVYRQVRTAPESTVAELSERIERLRSDVDEPTALIGSCLAALLHERFTDPPARTGLDRTVETVQRLVIEAVEAAELMAAGYADDDPAGLGEYEDVPTPLTDAEFRRHDQALDELWRARSGPASTS